jgi:glyoxylase I family protein
MPITNGIHHVAYRCKDAKETVAFYNDVFGMEYTTAFAEDYVPSTGEYDPYMHVFLDAGERQRARVLRAAQPKGYGSRREHAEWVQHIAFKVNTLSDLDAAKTRAEARGLDVIGPTDHGIFKSIYFFDPNGHRLELTADTGTADELAELKRVAPMMLDEWSRTKKAPQHAAWLHEKARAAHAAAKSRIGE